MKREFKKDDFKNLMLNVYEVNRSTNLIKHFPVLDSHNEFHVNLDGLEKYKNKIIRYIVYTYDKGSPLRVIDNLNERKIEAAILAGFKYDKKTLRFEEEVEFIFRGYNKKVNEMIIRYCRIMGHLKYTFLVAAYEDYFYNLKRAMGNEPLNTENKSTNTAQMKAKFFENAEKSLEKIEKLSNEILAEDNNKDINLDLYKVIDKETKRTLNLSPEKRYRKKDKPKKDSK